MAVENERIQRLEESQAFAEHTVEQLSGEMVELGRRLSEAMVRLERLERHLERIASGVLEREGEAGEQAGEQPPPSIH